MARRRKKEPAPRLSHAPQTPTAAPRPVRVWAADAGDDGLLVLYQDPARGVLMIAPAEWDQPLRLAAPARAFLMENGFAAETPDGPWTRPIDPACVLADRIDAERVLLKAAELNRGDSPGRSTGRRGR